MFILHLLMVVHGSKKHLAQFRIVAGRARSTWHAWCTRNSWLAKSAQHLWEQHWLGVVFKFPLQVVKVQQFQDLQKFTMQTVDNNNSVPTCRVSW